MARIPGRFEKLDSSLGLQLFLFVAVSVFLLFCVSKHVPWRDEYQTFLVSTRTKTWAEFWTATRYERTPPLHYLLQRFFWPILNGFIGPRSFIRALTLPFSLLTFFLLFFRFRFGAFLALLLALNVYFFREWGVISRSYAIGGALLLLSLDLRNRGRPAGARVLLALAGATHLLFFFAAGAILAIDLFDDFRAGRAKGAAFFTPLVPVAAILGAVAFHAIPPADSIFATSPTFPGPLRVASEGLRILSVALFPIEAWDLGGILSGTWSWNHSPLGFGWVFLLVIPVWFYFRKDRALLARLGVATIPLFFVFTCAYGPSLRHTAVLFVLLVYFMARVDPARRNRRAAVAIAAGPFLAALYWLAIWNPPSPAFAFSDAASVKPYFFEAETVYTVQDFTLFPAMAETGRDVFDVRSDRTASYPYFRIPALTRTIDDFCRRRERYPLRAGDLFVFPTAEFASAARLEKDCGPWRLVYESKGAFATDETFKVYRFSGDAGG